MAIYAIFRATNSAKLDVALTAEYGKEDFLALGGGAYLLSSGDTTPKVSERLGITSGESGSAIVIRMSNYHGRTNPEVWEWIESKLEKSRG